MGDDWKEKAESHNHTYANQTQTIYSMGQAPKVVSQVLPGPLRTCEFKQKQYCDGRFQAELQIFRENYRLERYAIAGSGPSYTILQRTIDRNYITNIRARVRGTNPALEISLNAGTRDSKAVSEELVDQIITAILGAAFEASGLQNPCGDIIVPEEDIDPVFKADLASVMGDVEVSSDDGPWRPAGNEQITLGDRIRTGGNGRVRIFWAIPPSDGHYYFDLGPNSGISFYTVYSSFRREQYERRWGVQLTRGALRVWRKVRSVVRGLLQRPVTIRAPGVDCTIQGTDVIFYHDPATRFFNVYVIDGRVEMLDERTGNRTDLAEGQKISVRDGRFSPVQSLGRSEWDRMIASHGLEGEDLSSQMGDIPSIQATVSQLNFYEGGGDGVAREQRTYLNSFSPSDSRYIYWELNLTHPDLRQRIDFAVDAVWYRPDGSEFARQTLNSYILNTWSTSYHQTGRGWQEPGNWKPGAYRVDLMVGGKKVASGSFVMVDAGGETIITSAYQIPSLRGRVISIDFYEGGLNAIPQEQRQYSSLFSSSSAKAIWWELKLDHADPSRKIDFAIEAVYIGPDGNVLNRQTNNTAIQSGLDNLLPFTGLGLARARKMGGWDLPHRIIHQWKTCCQQHVPN